MRSIPHNLGRNHAARLVGGLACLVLATASVIGCGGGAQTCDDGPACPSFVRIDAEDDNPDTEGARLADGDWVFRLETAGQALSTCFVELPRERSVSIDCQDSHSEVLGYVEAYDSQFQSYTLSWDDESKSLEELKSQMPGEVTLEVTHNGESVYSNSWNLTYETEAVDPDTCRTSDCRHSVVEVDGTKLRQQE